MATLEKGDAMALTGVIIDELTSAGLSTDKILSQVYDGASLMSGRRGGVQKLLQKKLDRDIGSKPTAAMLHRDETLKCLLTRDGLATWQR